MTIRRLTGRDVAAWRALRLEGLAAHPEAFLTTVAEMEAQTLDENMARIDESMTFGTFDGEHMTGTISVDPKTGATAHRAVINAVYVSKAARRRGLAKALVDAAISAARDTGFIQLELFVAAENAPAINLYRAAGFREIGRIPRAVRLADRYQDDLMLALQLDA